ncbi:MAG: hypothetical protein UT67_C0005G0032 [Candidatus Magasanikbacteria bacterium GW2011_GWA2_40_10]|uniref:Uncharacterized protein n=1 Tax=Candidatus Magasanikbacteria bacterium GW2011_GWA2_40_10 TaxID=1619037 RepID=A0A0G0SJM7_9BACT|nr:MAG: hypothetical protein UT67_C0005G0032 [Candidatus Magasanikbacteria bacterium GW2011_GWA2_40_10]
MMNIIGRVFGGVRRKEMIVGGQTYEVATFSGSIKKIVGLDTMVKRAKYKKIVITDSNFKRLFVYQRNIPEYLRGQVVFALVGSNQMNDSVLDIRCLFWSPLKGWENVGLNQEFTLNGSCTFISDKL